MRTFLRASGIVSRVDCVSSGLLGSIPASVSAPSKSPPPAVSSLLDRQRLQKSPCFSFRKNENAWNPEEIRLKINGNFVSSLGLTWKLLQKYLWYHQRPLQWLVPCPFSWLFPLQQSASGVALQFRIPASFVPPHPAERQSHLPGTESYCRHFDRNRIPWIDLCA